MYQIVADNMAFTGENSMFNFIKFSNSVQAAKEHCEEDFGGEIDWVKCDSGWRSPDLGKVCYRIIKVVPIDEGR